MVRMCAWSLIVLFAVAVAHAQDAAQSFDEVPLTRQQQTDVLRVTGDQSDQADIPGKPFIELLGLSANKTKPPLIVAWRGDGGMGNKDIWIFQQTGKHAMLILSNAGGSMYASLRSIHHGMHDFITFWNMGGGTGGNEVFEFDGTRYRPAYCYDTLALGSDNDPEKDGPRHPCKKD